MNKKKIKEIAKKNKFHKNKISNLKKGGKNEKARTDNGSNRKNNGR